MPNDVRFRVSMLEPAFAAVHESAVWHDPEEADRRHQVRFGARTGLRTASAPRRIRANSRTNVMYVPVAAAPAEGAVAHAFSGLGKRP
jgi:hypothetical protein